MTIKNELQSIIRIVESQGTPSREFLVAWANLITKVRELEARIEALEP